MTYELIRCPVSGCDRKHGVRLARSAAQPKGNGVGRQNEGSDTRSLTPTPAAAAASPGGSGDSRSGPREVQRRPGVAAPRGALTGPQGT